MADLGVTISQTTAAAAYGRAEGLGASIPVRPADPIRQRFQLADEVAADQADGQAQAAAADGDEQASAARSGGRQSASGFGAGLLGAFTSFLARFFGQGEGDEAVAATSAMRSGAAAYGRAAAAGLAGDPAVEVMAPSFPRLASGRALDLTV